MVRITSSTVPPENIRHYRPWLLGDGSRFEAVEVESVRPHRHEFVARIRGVDDRDRAQALKGLLIAVPRRALPEPEPGREFYWRDLMGMTVTNASGEVLGVVDHLLETGAHDVLVVRGGSREVLIPFVDPFVVDVELEARSIRVDWQEPV